MKRPTFKALSLALLFAAEACLILMLSACHRTTAVSCPVVSTNPLVQYRFEWNYKTLVEPYEKAGHTSPRWDEPAKCALTEFARVRSQCTESNEAWELIISTNCIAAANAGCDDPMVRYLFIRFALDRTNSKTVFLKAFCETARDMQNSTYPPVRKFYAATRALDQIFSTYGTNSPQQPVEGEIMPWISQNVVAALNDKTMPAHEAYEMANDVLYLVSGDTNNFQQAYRYIEQPLMENWPDDYNTWLLKGTACIQMAWNARGDYADTVSNKGGKLFHEQLAAAQAALEQAWKLNPQDPEIARQMMTVMLGQGGGRNRMELWFDRAMALNPNDYDACSKKLYYLEPKWHGSTEAMLDFGRECVQNTNWGGRVPLILVDAHSTIYSHYIDPSQKNNYWKQPDVWADIQSAYNRFFQLTPHAAGYYEYYAWYAYQAGQWDVLNGLIPKLGPETYYRFGGRAGFDKMVQQAQEHGGGPK